MSRGRPQDPIEQIPEERLVRPRRTTTNSVMEENLVHDDERSPGQQPQERDDVLSAVFHIAVAE